jgi:GT2 family glycosyltransferase
MLRRFSFIKSAARRLAQEIELLHNSPLVDPVWYRQKYADVRDTPIDVARHYLEHGAGEGRNPSPFFNTTFYLEQNTDVADSGMNPLVHFILHGQKEGRIPRPPATIASPLPTKNCSRSQLTPVTADAPSHSTTVSEPGIKPPRLVATELSPSEVCRRNAQIMSAVRNLRAKNGRFRGTEVQERAELDYDELCCIKLNLIGSEDGISGEALAFGTRDVLGQGDEFAFQDALMGLGITPYRTISENDLPSYETPILRRYNEGRLRATKRFSLDPLIAGTINLGPRLSILVPVYKTPIVFLERAILSVLFQTYKNWELVLVDDFSQQPNITVLLTFYASVDPRVKVHFRDENSGISAATNDALAMASGSYIGLLDHDDMLARDALEKVADALTGDEAVDFVYTDECKIDRNDVTDDLFHKPDWSPLLLLNFMYTGHFSVYRKALIQSIGGFRSKYDFSQDYDLVLRVAERQPKVAHIEEILYGWRMIPGSGASGDRPDARVSNIAALQDAADRRGYEGVAIPLPRANRVRRRLNGYRPLISIIVPSDSFLNIRESVNSIVSHSTYDNYEVLIVTNSRLIATHAERLASSTIQLINYDKPFNFSEKCNVGASHAKGDYVIFYNDDVRVISPDWIETILECLTLSGVGGVSPKLTYENGTIQYAGLVTGVRRLVGTAFHCYPSKTTAYVNLAQSMREVSILSGACLAMSKRLFNEIGGWDEHNAPSAHSDVDLCFRLREHGYSCVYTPHAELTHLGHVAIGASEAEAKTRPFNKDKADIFVLKRWGRYCQRDPYFPTKMRDLVYIDSQEEFILEKSGSQISSASGKDFILFSHDLSASGAPRCLYEAAKVLIDEGHYVLVISPEDGAFRKRFIEIGADVIVDPLALSGHKSVVDLAKNFDVAICNTIVCWALPRHLAHYLPVYLHSHETDLVRHFCDTVPSFREGLSAATAIWAEGPRATSIIKEFCGLAAVTIDPCVEELPALTIAKEDYPGEAVIALVGTYEPRKGQDLAIDGFKALPEDLQKISRLVLAGRTNDRKFRQEIEERAKGNTHIVFLNELNYQEVTHILRRADIVLVPSRDDAGPTTAMDALSAGKILIASANSGISHFLVDGETGFILRDNDPECICATLGRVFEKRQRWPEIGARAREIYEAHFTRQRFKDQLLNALGPLQ